MIGKVLLAAVVLAAIAACGSEAPAPASDVAAFRATAAEIDAAAAAYGTAAGAALDRGACLGTHAGYDGQVRPMVDRMGDVAGSMDARMASTCGDARHADMACATEAMRAELDRHHAAACASESDAAANAAEAAAHVAAMREWAEHQQVRAGELDAGAMHHGGMHGGSATFTCPAQ